MRFFGDARLHGQVVEKLLFFRPVFCFQPNIYIKQNRQGREMFLESQDRPFAHLAINPSEAFRLRLKWLTVMTVTEGEALLPVRRMRYQHGPTTQVGGITSHACQNPLPNYGAWRQ
jgi:hypothetical protein